MILGIRFSSMTLPLLSPVTHFPRAALLGCCLQIFAVLPLVAADSAPRSSPVAIEDLFRRPKLSSLRLSPSGAYFGAITSDDAGNNGLIAYDLQTTKTWGMRSDAEFEVYSFGWIDDDHLFYHVSQSKLYAFGLYAATREQLNRGTPIASYDPDSMVPYYPRSILALPRKRKDRAIVWTAEDRGDGDLVELNLSVRPRVAGVIPTPDQSVMHRYTPPAGSVVGWGVDFDGEVALCTTYASAAYHFHWLNPESKTWQEVPLDIEKVSPMGIDADGHSLWIVMHDAEHGFSLRRYDLKTSQLGEPVLTDPDYDIAEGSVYFSRRSREMVGVVYEQRRTKSVWFSPLFKVAQATVDHAQPKTDNVLVSHDDNDNRFLFSCGSDTAPSHYLLLDVAAKSLRQLSTGRPWLTAPLAATQPISYHARDGLKLEGYLTLPPGASEAHPAPLVVLAHGGPWVRDGFGFDAEVQFLASRGYAVIQPNYRGSTGYGPEISSKDRYEFRKMHEDVTDAARAMCKLPMIDPHRVAIMGGSFGGYLALAGVAFEPDLYRCAISLAGVFDWEEQIRSERYNARPGQYQAIRDKLGNSAANRAKFDEMSPLFHVNGIHVPVLVAHGEDDHTVELTQSLRLIAALKKNGVPYETFFRAGEAHGFFIYKNEIDYYRTVEAFLARNMGPATAPTRN